MDHDSENDKLPVSSKFVQDLLPLSLWGLMKFIQELNELADGKTFLNDF